MTQYTYHLGSRIEKNIVSCQSTKLLSDGYVYNAKLATWDKYESVYDEIVYLDLTYLQDIEVEVPVSRYLKHHTYTVDYIDYVKKSVPVNQYIIRHDVEVQYQEPRNIARDLFRYELEKDEDKIFSVSYIERGESFFSGFLSFFKKAFNIKKTEPAVPLARLNALQKLQRSGKITDLEIETMNEGKTIMDMTEWEFRRMVGKGYRILQLEDEPIGTKEVREIVSDSETMEANMVPVFSKGREGREILSKKDIIETVELTAREYQERGEALKLHKQNVRKKDETTEIQGHATIEASEYDRFILNKQEIRKEEHKETIDLTDTEYLAQMKSGNSYPLITKDVGKKMETQQQHGSATIKKEEYTEFMTDKKELSRNERTERELREKILVDQREEVEYNYQYYQPGIWSRRGNHSEGNMANFVIQIHITYISGFSPWDPDCLDRDELQEEIVSVIEEEHGNSIYIRGRDDGKDGFKIEKARIS